MAKAVRVLQRSVVMLVLMGSGARTMVFDVRITDTDAKLYCKQDPLKILQSAEQAKKRKYQAACQENHKDFTPLVFSVDGLRALEAVAAVKRLAALLSEKWQRAYSLVCGYVRSCLGIALVRSTNLCLCRARNPTSHASGLAWESGDGLWLFRSH